DVDRLNRLYGAHISEQKQLRGNKQSLLSAKKFNEEQVSKLGRAIARRTPVKAGEFAATVDGQVFDNREEFSNALFAQFKDLAERYIDATKPIGDIGGFALVFHGINMKGGNYAAALHIDIPGDPTALLTFPI